MKIISIKKKGRNYLIRLENNSTLLLDGDLLSKFNLYEDLDLSDNDINAITKETEFRKAFASALRMLARRSHSENEIVIKLKQKKHNDEAIERVVEKLTYLNYLDDEKFAGEFFEYAVKRKKIGPRKIIHELKRKGISREIINKIDSGADEDIFFTNACSAAEKKMSAIAKKSLDKEKMRHKLFAFLQQKGYETETIYKVLNNMNF